jgi:Xaa-Pro aminopeptidase
MPDVLVYGDTFRSPELRHEVPLGIPDPFLYAEKDGARHIAISSMEAPRLAEIGGYRLHSHEELGIDDLVAEGVARAEATRRLAVRAVHEVGVRHALVPETFPLWLADRLRGEGVELTVDAELFADRRRVKTAAELDGIRRAQRAAEAGMDAARDLLRRASPSGGALVVDGEPLTAERLKVAIAEAIVRHGAAAEDFIVAPGAQGAVGHVMGSGPIAPGVPLVIDLWPRDNESSCYADMTRTFVVGEPPLEIVDWHALVKQALERAVADIRAGVEGRAVFEGTCDVFEAAGHPTQRTKAAGEVLADGFFHGLGHGVGLEVHEPPGMGRAAEGSLRAGDVVTVEPGLYRQGFGGVRLEDLVLVTDDGAENLTHYSYELAP